MSALNDFLDEDRALIVSIPVRAGYWIAHIDDVQGSVRDDRREQLALERALKLIVTKTDDDRFINDVAEFALSSQINWPEWSDHAGTVLADIPKALKLIEGTLSAKELKDYKSAVYRVAGVVAQAAHEEGDAAKKDGGILSKLADRLSVKTDMSVPENISPTEKAALQKLMACLKG